MKIKPWLELIRLPNLFSVPGDPLAGYAFAAVSTAGGIAFSPTRMGAAIAVALLLYMAGLILNDLMDYQEDLRDRPERPLPSGNVSVPAAWTLFAVCCVVAMAIAWSTGKRSPVFMTVMILLFVCLYNGGFKNIRILGPVSMGLCRGCSMLLGAAMFGGEIDDLEPLVYAVHTAIIYIALLTLVADYETRPHSPAGIPWLAPAVLVGGLVLVYLAQPGHPLAYCAAGSFAVYMNVQVALRIRKRGKVIPPDIGGMIGALMFLQAAWLFLNGALIAGGVIAALWPFNRFVVRRIYAS